MNSMTGFGRDLRANKNISLEVSIKTVNGRYLDVRVSSPRLYGEFESEIKKRTSAFFERGTVEVYIYRNVLSSSESVFFNEALGKQWLKGYKKLLRSLDIPGEIPPEILLKIPDLCQIESERVVRPAEKKFLFSALKKALEACQEERAREGKALKKDLTMHLQHLGKGTKEILALRKKSEKEFKAKYKARLAKIQQSLGMDDSRLAQEMTLLVEKSDISEELQRLGTHIKEIKSLVNSSGRVGKALDFFTQELLREVNTIGSKSVTAAITKKVVECKGTIEKFREQVQNIE